MKKFTCKFLSVLLVLALLCGGVPVTALAAEESAARPVGARSEAEGIHSLPPTAENVAQGEEAEEPALSHSSAQVYGAFKNFSGDMYSQLSTRQQAVYSALRSFTLDQILSGGRLIYSDGTYYRLTTKITGISDTYINGTIAGGGFTPTGSGIDQDADISTDISAALVALRYDSPDLFWLDNIYYSYHVVQTGGSTPKIAYLMFDFLIEFAPEEEKAIYNTVIANAKAIADQAADQPDTYSKVKYVHDVLSTGNSYNYTPANATEETLSHLAYSALVFDDVYEPVCDGYSKAFKLICDELNIPCVMASSAGTEKEAGHMWNNVKMDDGLWYNFDLTWDDSDDAVLCYDYFLIGNQTVVDGKPFAQQSAHLEENPFDVYREADPQLKPITLCFPTKSSNAYEYLGQDYPPLRFEDVPRSSWAYSYVERAAELELFVGNEKGYFEPDKNITRSQFAVVMANAMGADLTQYSESSFDDVPANTWYTRAVAWAEDMNIMVGSGGKFRPSDFITRQEMCVALCKVIGYSDNEPSEAFADDSKISSWARSAVYTCKEKRLVVGDDKGYFNPLGNTQRSSAAVVFTKLVDLLSLTASEPEEAEPAA